MKRLSVFLLALIIVFSLFIPAALAYDGSFYYISGLNAFITAPDNLIVFTREEFPDSDTLTKYGLTEEDASDILNMMVDSNVLFRALDISGTSEHVIVCNKMAEESGISDFDELSDEELMYIINNVLIVDGTKNGYDYQNYDLYRNDEASYIALSFRAMESGSPVYGLEYYTVKNGSAISIIFRSYDKSISKEAAVRHREMVDSLSFYNDSMTDDGTRYEEESENGALGVIPPLIVIFILVLTVLRQKKVRKKASAGQNPAPTPRSQIMTAKQAGVAPAAKSRIIETEDRRKVIVPREGSVIESVKDDDDFYAQSYRKPSTYCSQCGAKVYDNGHICPICGARVKRKKRDYEL